jgi:hypothetical protein
MAITAAADKTNAAFFMDFPFTKIKRQAKAFCRLTGNALSIASSFAWNSQPEQKNRKPEICSGQIRNSELHVCIRQWAVDSKQAIAKFKLGRGVQFHFLENRFDTRDLRAVLDHEEPLPPSGK